MASRNESVDNLRINRKQYGRPDAVLIGCYKIINHELYLLLESQFRPALNREVISFPAGLMDPEDNDIKETAIREVKEETGYDVSHVELLLPASNKEEFEDIDAALCSREKIKEMLLDDSYLFSNSARLLILYLLERFKNV